MEATRWSKSAYYCEACNEWHDLADEPLVEVEGWNCDCCEGWHEGEMPETVTVIYAAGREYIAVDDAATCEMMPCPDDGDGYASDACMGASRWRAECGALLEKEPDTSPAWQCGECSEIHEDREEAKLCCTD